MNSVSQNIKKLGSDYTSSTIFNTINELENITEQLLANFDNNVSFTTSEMQLLAKISRDPTKLVYAVNVKNVFDKNFDISGALFEPTTYESVGLSIKILRFSFKVNPHKLNVDHFQDQPRYFPLIIYKTYKQPSSVKRVLQTSITMNPTIMNITYTFEVNNPSSLTNLICLTLSDWGTGKYIICPNIQILTSQVICKCQNSATLYEDINYNYLPQPNDEVGKTNKAPLSMIIAIIILSILLALLLIVQIRGRRNTKSSVKLDEAYAKSRATAIAARKRQQELDQNPINTELKDVRKSMQESHSPTHYNTKSEDYRNYDTIFNQSPILNAQRHAKLVIGGVGATGGHNVESDIYKEYYMNEKLDFYGTNKNEKIEEYNQESETPEQKIDYNMITPAMEQKFNDSALQNKNQRGSVMLDDSESQKKDSQVIIEKEQKKGSIIKFDEEGEE